MRLAHPWGLSSTSGQVTVFRRLAVTEGQLAFTLVETYQDTLPFGKTQDLECIFSKPEDKLNSLSHNLCIIFCEDRKGAPEVDGLEFKM